MKLIIDIPDKDYEKLKDGHIPFSILDVMQDGIPLDKIRAEIEQMDFDFGDFYDHTDSIVEKVLQVIDKCRESEG